MMYKENELYYTDTDSLYLDQENWSIVAEKKLLRKAWAEEKFLRVMVVCLLLCL